MLSRSAHLLKLALLLTGWNAAVAEDLTQAVLERAYGRRRALFGADQAAEPYVRRMLVNACYWAVGLEDQIPAKADVELVGDYRPRPFGFGSYAKGRKPSDYGLK